MEISKYGIQNRVSCKILYFQDFLSTLSMRDRKNFSIRFNDEIIEEKGVSHLVYPRDLDIHFKAQKNTTFDGAYPNHLYCTLMPINLYVDQ